MKKIIYLTVFLVIVGGAYWELSPEKKLGVFTVFEKYWGRLRINKPSTFINETRLQEKIKQGLPRWAHTQIQEDLSHYTAFSETDLDAYFKKFDTIHNKLVRVKIKNGELEIVPGKSANIKEKSYTIMHNVLKFLCTEGYIGDTDFILSLQDYVELDSSSPAPIFTFSKDLATPLEKDLILIPDWMNLRSRAELIPRIRFANYLYPWENKKPIVFWRGSVADSSGFRQKLVALSSAYPTLIDAKFSQFDPKEYVSEERHVPYRYQITIDGARGTWERFVWQLQANCLLFKQNSQHVQWFYKGVQPQVHFVPVWDEQSLLKEIAHMEKNPKDAEAIIQNATQFAQDNLALEDMYHYIIVLLQQYNEKLKK